jgi:hypothetical protein
MPTGLLSLLNEKQGSTHISQGIKAQRITRCAHKKPNKIHRSRGHNDGWSHMLY